MYYNEVHYEHHPVRHAVSVSVSTLIGIAGGVIILLLAARFVLSFVQIDQLPSFADLVFSASYPFAAPFAKLLGRYQSDAGLQTVVAIMFWAILSWFLVHVANLADDKP